MANEAPAKSVDAEKELAVLREEMDAMHAIMAGGCCPINSRGDKDIYDRKFSLPVNAHTTLEQQQHKQAA